MIWPLRNIHIVTLLSIFVNKPVVIGGAILLVISLIIAGVGLASGMKFDPSENIIHDTSTDGIEYADTGDTLVIAVYAKGDIGCTGVDISITNGITEFFVPDCSQSNIYSNTQFTYLGDAYIPVGDVVEIISSNNIVLVSHDNVGIGGLGMIGGCCCSFIGLVILIIGLFIGKNKVQQGVMMVQQSDGTFQQVGGIPAPVQGAPTVAGGVHPAYTTEQPIIQQPIQQGGLLPPISGQQPPNQGF